MKSDLPHFVLGKLLTQHFIFHLQFTLGVGAGFQLHQIIPHFFPQAGAGRLVLFIFVAKIRAL